MTAHFGCSERPYRVQFSGLMGNIYCTLSFRYLRIYRKGDVGAWAEVWAMDLCSTLIYLFLLVRVGATWQEEDQPCQGRVLIDRHADATKSVQLALVALNMYVRS